MTDKPPSAWRIQKAMAAWREASEVDGLDELDDIWGATAIQGDIRGILHALVQSSVHAGDMAVAAAQREAAICERKKRFLAREERLRQIITDLMVALDIKKDEWGDVALSLRPNTRGRKWVITHPDAIPDEYVDVEVVRKPRTKDISVAYEDGVVVPGTEVANGSAPILTIRTK